MIGVDETLFSIYISFLILVTVYLSSHSSVVLIISCHIMIFIISKSFAYSCNLLLCFMSTYTIYLRSGYGKELYVPEGTITVRDSDFYQYDPNEAAIMIQTESMSSTQTRSRYL